jgi:Tfp pilus assembly protein PilF
MRRPLSFGLTLLTLTALYLIGPGWNAMGVGAACVLLLHIGLGFALLVPVALALAARFRAIQGARQRAHVGLICLTLLTCGCGASGGLLCLYAAMGRSTARDVALWWLHVVAGFLAVGILGFAALRRARSAVPSGRLRPRRTTGALTVLMLFSPCVLWAAAVWPDYFPDTYYRDLTATNVSQAQSPYFPAGLRLEGEDSSTRRTSWQLPSSAYCGRAGCHVAAYREWLPSGHHWSGTDPFYQRVAADYAARSGAEAARWCAGCHAPGTLGEDLTPNPSPGQSLRLLRSGERQGTNLSPLLVRNERQGEGAGGEVSEGVGCVVCHATVGTPTRTGDGRFTLALPGDYPFAAAERGWSRRLHDFLLRVRPGPHQRAYLRPTLHSSPEFCASCHRQSFNVPQNHYQFVRGPDSYGEWLAGPYSGRTARPPGRTVSALQTCQDCHFPRSGGHVSHASLGANTAVPTLLGDPARCAQTEAFLQANRVTLDLFAIRRPLPGLNQQETWIAPLDSPTDPATAVLRPGETVWLDIVVSNRGIGHSFPAGYEDIKDVWLEVRLEDAHGRTLLASGMLASAEDTLPADTHAYRMAPLDSAGNLLTQHNLTQMVTMAYRNVIAPGSSDIARYLLTVPQRGPDGQRIFGPLRLTARLRYRHVRPDFVRWALGAAFPLDLPITTLAQVSVSLPLQTHPLAAPNAQRPPASETALRFIDYGIGLLAPQDTPDLPHALRAFQRAQELAPDRPEAWLGMGRAYLAESALLAAGTQFEAALRRAPGDPAVRAYLGVVASKQGQYDNALRLLTPLAEQFPQDSALLFDLGQARFQLGDYAAAAVAFQRALAADPDDAPAHYKLKRCYQYLRRIPEARREEAIGRYLAEDKLAAQLLPLYRRAHPTDTLATQAIPIHVLRPPDKESSR